MLTVSSVLTLPRRPGRGFRTPIPLPTPEGGDGRAGAGEGGALARGLGGGARAAVVCPFPRWALPRLPHQQGPHLQRKTLFSAISSRGDRQVAFDPIAVEVPSSLVCWNLIAMNLFPRGERGSAMVILFRFNHHRGDRPVLMPHGGSWLRRCLFCNLLGCAVLCCVVVTACLVLVALAYGNLAL